ncbi:hypothetical protein NGRA_2174 [Nosema granulosis]|uniref:Uncharacterized protein n=1 Tax=Nosema granulosis TaxID=83296 RepID=A0A9P6GX36_9MICR|nr:hypothetical protein NGRA_2174 [Nosema granulosis]
MYSFICGSRNSLLRRAAIFKVEEETKSPLSQILGYLETKYKLEGIITQKMLLEYQRDKLYNETKMRTNHGKLFKSRDHELVSINRFSTWLIKGNNQARSETM